jgi:hypothetical protein
MKAILLIAFLALAPALVDQFSPLPGSYPVAALADPHTGASVLTAPHSRERAELCGR